MGMVKDGRVVFGNDADRQRLIKSATTVKGKKQK
jgi:branched-chain amino acid transport system substrate-binding protein